MAGTNIVSVSNSVGRLSVGTALVTRARRVSRSKDEDQSVTTLLEFCLRVVNAARIALEYGGVFF